MAKTHRFIRFRQSYLIGALIILSFSESVFTANSMETVSPEEAARGVLERLLPQHADHFILETIPRVEGNDVFELESQDGKIALRGSNAVDLCHPVFARCDGADERRPARTGQANEKPPANALAAVPSASI